MARFRGTVKGTRGAASRVGSPNSGLSVRANGWDKGVLVTCNVEKGQDVFYIYETGGSNEAESPRLLHIIRSEIVD